MAERRKLHRSSGVYRAPSEIHYPKEVVPLSAPESLDRWSSLASGMGDLAQHMGQLEKIHASLNDKFNESFASFLYGLLITMFCNNFPECPNREQYEHRSIQGVSLRLETLQDRVRMAKAKNQQLRAEVERKEKERKRSRAEMPRGPVPGREVARSARETPRVETPTRNPLFQPVRSLKRTATKVAVAHDDTYSTNDSFLETPSHPNLNQPPRYMHGLFDKSSMQNRRPLSKGSAAQRAQRARQERLKTRPPFR